MSAPTAHSSVTLDRLTFTWPDGSTALDGLTGSFNTGRTGLVGRNGSGKSTLLRVIAGDLEPTSGAIMTTGDVAHLPQQLTLDTDRRVAELLGIAGALDAVRAIAEGGRLLRATSTQSATTGTSRRAPRSLWPRPALTRHSSTAASESCQVVKPCSSPSPASACGERRSRCSTSRPTISIATPAPGSPRWCAPGRERCIVVSHDVSLLELMDETAELYAHTLSVFGGPSIRSGAPGWMPSRTPRFRHSAMRNRRSRRRRNGSASRPRRSSPVGRGVANKAFVEKRVPKIIANGRKMAAQVSAGKLRDEVAEKEAEARSALDAARSAGARRCVDEDRTAQIPAWLAADGSRR